MMMNLNALLAVILIGIGATLILDLWALFLRKLFGVASFNFCLVGRWLGHMPAGVFRHANIANAAKRPAECLMGWSLHYLIGIAFAGMLTLFAGDWLLQPTLLPAVLFGIVTVLLPYLVMQPALGMSVAAANTPRPWVARGKSLMSHTVFGIGLYLAALPVHYLLLRVG